MGYANRIVSAQGKQPLLSFGVISDVQYADIPDGRSFLGVPRYYRHSLLVLQRAVHKWNEQKMKFVINFGDIIDGFCPKDQSLPTITRVIDEFNVFNGPVYHMIGNHCLYNLPHEKLLQVLNIPSIDGFAYYDFSPIPEYRFVVLDGYDISAIGWPKDHKKTLKALNFLRERNPNSDKNSPNGLVGLEIRFLMFNGAVGKEQIEWLDNVLQDATNSNQKVVVCCHLPLDPGASSKEALLWNYDEVMDVIHRYNCVKVCLAGHDHKGGHSVDSHCVHHRVLEAALECPPGTDAFGWVNLFDDRLLLSGTERIESQEMAKGLSVIALPKQASPYLESHFCYQASSTWD
ncbi:Manganese-dependent ADP-ribose/CDP-alcohol diphosphatase [Forsythia ovata]|uniref:Manganese-dependent ADP-ribose/CDP-alcohol diphosphatase n=1 Tax=Forsythia ovata TaxID=205694 RepID=A0ABD1TR89_9LAMI